MKFYINRSVVNAPWGGGNNFVRAMRSNVETANDRLVDRPDVLFVVGYDATNFDPSLDQLVMERMMYYPNAKIVLRVNENDARKGTRHVDKHLLGLSGHVDGTIFVSNWLKDHFLSLGWKCKNNTVIVNGVDREIFKPRERQPSDKVRIVSHHWSDNQNKSGEITRWIDGEFLKRYGDQFEFTFVGRTTVHMQRSKLINPLFGDELGEELSKHDVYISESKGDPGPNHLIEAIASGLPSYVHHEGGGGVEFAGQNHVFRSKEHLESILLSKNFVKNDDRFTTWEECIKNVERFCEKL